MTGGAALQSIWRYPVSSMGGERLDAVAIGPAGLDGDRLWGLLDAAGEIASPKRRRWRPTPHVLARVAGAPAVEVRLPGGDWRPGAAVAVDPAFAAHFGFPVRLVRHPGPDSDGVETVPPRYEVRAVHLVTTASLATLARRLPAPGSADRVRFRPNLVVDWPDRSRPFPESAWAPGLEVTVGAVRLRVVEPCRRCAFVTIAQPGVDQDPAVLDLLTRENGANLGALLEVVEPGRVATGDPVRIAGD
ncbi:MOSC domain-containing protein [Stella sp.]|uniref:MOSC domain-containing protein n=1 Tax=Stella sp. TaxID=2912054 RepID=UPI0035AE42EC